MTKTFLLASASAILAASPAAAEAQQPDPNARAAELKAQIRSLQRQVDDLKKNMAAQAAPSFKAAPQLADKDGGWSFKPLGRIQFDAGYVERPEGVTDRSLGFATEARRIRLGVEGDIPGGLGYKFEADFAGNEVEITDAILTYDVADNVGLTFGQHNNFQSLEELTSSRFSSFIERAAFTDAFNFERRVGVSAGYARGDFRVNAGVFTDNIEDLGNDENNSYSIDGRAVFSPKAGATQLHLGGSAHFRDLNDLEETGATTRYRQRPLVHTTDVRFLATPALGIEKETSYGLEAAAIRGPLHAAGEVHWLNADSAVGDLSPTFFGGYGEVGYFLTGETRGYKSGRFDRTKVLKPVGKGGMGALQLNLRYDYADLNDAGVTGGKQSGYLASLIWIPQDYVRFMLNYGRLHYEDAAVAAAGGDRTYGINVFGARAQVDF